MNLGRSRKNFKGWAAIRHYANLREPSFNLRFKLYWLLTDGLPLWISLRVGEAVHTPGAGAGGGGGGA